MLSRFSIVHTCCCLRLALARLSLACVRVLVVAFACLSPVTTTVLVRDTGLDYDHVNISNISTILVLIYRRNSVKPSSNL